MSTSVRATTLSFDEDTMWVERDDGRSLGIPLAWFPGLLQATAEQRHALAPDLDEDISVEGLIAGRGDQTAAGPGAA